MRHDSSLLQFQIRIRLFSFGIIWSWSLAPFRYEPTISLGLIMHLYEYQTGITSSDLGLRRSWVLICYDRFNSH